ncbi:hypothetical protein D9758_012225 [Tetrapyrgos nigripes]|uniref:Major facilitator superfamily (MFS) profile domain-containing protein n=1 Tax=Tetrapyrgos nigripes TaxID=182062 RepID=A0A8H5CAU3_9AGAR|nr:hypothetical protein D9758_012225 [Tetrapyrgos nigripes]
MLGLKALTMATSDRKTPPIGLKWRSSYWFITFVVSLGLATDMLVYSIIVPVMPFHLEELGYDGVSGLSGWLLFAFSAGLLIATFPAAMFSERYDARQSPLVLGVIILVGSQIMLMEAPVYWLMVLARVLQGVGSTCVWVVGMALICDATPKEIVARQIGLAMSGFSLGVVVGPPAGGALYERFGFRGPFIFWNNYGRCGSNCAAHCCREEGCIEMGCRSIEGDETRRQCSPDQAANATVPDENGANVQAGGADEKASAGLAESEKEKQENVPREKPLSLLPVLGRLCRSPRAMNASFMALVYGIVYSCQEPTLPLHLQDVWSFQSGDTGLVFLAGVVPTLFSSPLTGYISDRFGTAWITLACLLLSLPWWIVMIVELNVVLFIASFSIENLFTSGILSPLMSELAAVAREDEGIGYAHVYAAFNLVFGIGSAVGPIIGGQVYDNSRRGWMIICILSAGLVAVGMVVSSIYTGEEPVVKRLLRAMKRDKSRSG